MILCGCSGGCATTGSAAGGEQATPKPVKARDAGHATRGRLGLVLHQARYDLLAFCRNRQARFFTLILPILFLVIFVSVFGNNKIGPGHIKASTYYVPGHLRVGGDRRLVRQPGDLDHRAARGGGAETPPLDPGTRLGADRRASSDRDRRLAGGNDRVLLIGRFGYGVKLPPRHIPGVVVTAVVGAITFCCLAYALATAIHSADAAQPMVQAIMLPLYFISGVFIPNVNLPSWLRHVAEMFPVQHLADGLHHAFDPATHGSGIVWTDLGVLALWGAAGLAVALTRFTWTPAAATR